MSVYISSVSITMVTEPHFIFSVTCDYPHDHDCRVDTIGRTLSDSKLFTHSRESDHVIDSHPIFRCGG